LRLHNLLRQPNQVKKRLKKRSLKMMVWSESI